MKPLKSVIVGSLLGLSLSAQAADKLISISSEASYHDVEIIPEKIVNSCTALGGSFSNSTKEFLEKQGWSVTQTTADIPQGTGTELKLTITNALSSGNAFIGHSKSVAIKAYLYQDGELVDSYSESRSSGGGFGAGFKGSCTVLNRCVHTLGNDITKWLKTKGM